MPFAFPIAFLLAGLALPIVGLYILKVRMRRVPVSTNLFWSQIYDEKKPRSIWQNFKHLLSLIAQLLMLSLLVIAVADPFLPWQSKAVRRVVLIIDPSASMQAADVNTSRFSKAIASAQQMVISLRETDQAAIVLATATPEVVVGMTDHSPTLRRAIESIQPTNGATFLKPAIELGKRLLGTHPDGEVIVFTDGCTSEAELVTSEPTVLATGNSPVELISTSPEGSATPEASAYGSEQRKNPVRFVYIGDATNNIGITAFQARRTFRDIVGYEIMVSVSNASKDPVQARLEISLNDVPVDIVPLRLKPGERWTKSLEKASTEGGTLTARLTNIEPAPAEAGSAATNSEQLNGLTSDDIAWATLPERKIQKVLLITPGNWFLQKVFEANSLVNLEVRKDFPETWPSDAIVIFHRNTPPQIIPGNVFVIDPDNNSDLWTVGGVLENPIITEQAEDSPLMTHIRMDNVLVPEARRLQFTQSPKVLAGTVSGDSVYSEIDRSTGKCLVLGVNLDQSDLAFRTSFPILISNALSWFANQDDQLRPALPTGSLFTFELPPDEKVSYSAVSPSGNRSPIIAKQAVKSVLDPAAQSDSTVPSNLCTIGPLDEIGVWKIVKDAETLPSNEATTDLEVVQEVAVNLSNERETDLRPAVAAGEVSQARESMTWPSFAWLVRPLWFYFACLAFAFTALEWFFYQRRVIA